MSTVLPNETLTFLQNGEPVSGGTAGDSTGILNRPLVQLLADVKAVRDAADTNIAEVVAARNGQTDLNTSISLIRTEVVNARNGQSTLLAEVQNLQTQISATMTTSAYETAAAEKRKVLCSGILPPHFGNLTRVGVVSEYAVNVPSSEARKDEPGLVTPLPDKLSAGLNENKLYLIGNPLKVNVNGFVVTLESNPANFINTEIVLPANPTGAMGTRQDMAMLEVWKEKVVVNSATAAFFPFGNVDFAASGTINSCTLSNTNATGGDNPLYLATTAEHGYYVRANDANIAKFIADPNNNVYSLPGGDVIQIRYRIRTLQAHVPTNLFTSTDFALRNTSGTFFAPQGMLASRPAAGTKNNANGIFCIQDGRSAFRSILSDPGVMIAGQFDNKTLNTVSGLSYDNMVYAVPLCLVHRRNTTAFSITNLNGGGTLSSGVSGRPDGKYCDVVDHEDVLDLLHRVDIQGFDFQSVYEESFNALCSGELRTNWEVQDKDPDGNGTFEALNIYGTSRIIPEGITADGFDSSFNVVRRLNATTGEPLKPDGMRNLFTDMEAEQAVVGMCTNENNDAFQPTGRAFSYVASTHIMTVDATKFASGFDQATNATKLATRKPDVYWTTNGPSGTKQAAIYGAWSNLGTLTASFTLRQETWIDVYTPIPTNTVVGQQYLSDNSVTVTARSRDLVNNHVCFTFTGAVFPTSSGTTWAKVGGGQGCTNAAIYAAATGSAPQGWIWGINEIVTYDLSKMEYVGEGYDLHDAGSFTVTAYFQFPAGSALTSRVPKYGRSSLKGSQYYLDGTTQILPENGIGWVPFGAQTYPVVASAADDIYCKSTNLSGFVRTQPVLGSNHLEPNGYNAYNGCSDSFPCVIKDDTTYKKWWSASDGNNYRILYATSSDGLIWTTPKLVFNLGSMPTKKDSAGYSAISVIKEGATFRAILAASTVSSGASDILVYSESLDGITWSTPRELPFCRTEPNGYDSSLSAAPSLIKDGLTYKIWYGGSNGTNFRILYTTSSDLITWTTPQMALNIGGTYQTVHCAYPATVKDGTSSYKMLFSGHDGTSWKTLSSTSTDGLTWTTPVLVFNLNAAAPASQGFDATHAFGPTLMLDGSTWKVWYMGMGNTRKVHLYSTSTNFTSWTAPVLASRGTGTEPNGYNLTNSNQPTILKESSTYKCWFIGTGNDGKWRILYSTSTDMLTWTAPVLSLNYGTAPSGFDAYAMFSPHVLKVGSTYHLYYSGHTGGAQQILHTTSTTTDGAGWGTIERVYANGVLGSSYDSVVIDTPKVIYDGSTFKMWCSAYGSGSLWNLIYLTSADGSTWTNHTSVISNAPVFGAVSITNPLVGAVIKDGLTYKMFFFAGVSGKNILFQSLSRDGISWSAPQAEIILGNTRADFTAVLGQAGFTLIKDGSTYKVLAIGSTSLAGSAGIQSAILTMFDPSNTGSSLTGVYATEGTQNMAPRATDEIILMYETATKQDDITRIGGSPVSSTGSIEYVVEYISPEALISTLGTGGIPTAGYPISYRNLFNNVSGYGNSNTNITYYCLSGVLTTDISSGYSCDSKTYQKVPLLFQGTPAFPLKGVNDLPFGKKRLSRNRLNLNSFGMLSDTSKYANQGASLLVDEGYYNAPDMTCDGYAVAISGGLCSMKADLFMVCQAQAGTPTFMPMYYYQLMNLQGRPLVK